MNATNIPTDSRSPRSDAELHPCGVHRKDGRNLIVCIDGTSNQFGEKNTNVIELYNLILKEVEDNQRTWYNSGIGTYARPSWKSLKYYRQVLYHKIDLAIAWDFERTVLAAYRWLSDNYERGDCIFLFGFSRGAFQVRVLSAMIDKVGLIYKGNEMQIPFAYELYSDPKSDEKSSSVTQVGSPESPQRETSSAERFKKAFSYKDVKVHFVGAWDTVSSIGIARGSHMLPRTVDGMKHVCYFRHALALDERRVKFLPEYAYGGSALAPTKSERKEPPARTWWPKSWFSRKNVVENTVTGSNPPATNGDMANDCKAGSNSAPPQTLEVWFAGTHSDIGGGNVVNAGMDRSMPPLRWMVFEAGALGIRTALFERELSPAEEIEIQESLTWPWWLLELLPLKRLTYTRQENGNRISHKPHLGSSRKIHRGQKIHSSISHAVQPDESGRKFHLGQKIRSFISHASQLDKKYTPKARPLDNDPEFWNTVHSDKAGEWLEHDLYTNIDELVKVFAEKLDSNSLHVLQQTATWGDGIQALYKAVVNALDSKINTENKYELLKYTTDILRQADRQFKDHHSVEIYHSMSVLPTILESNSEGHKDIGQQFLAQCTSGCILKLSTPDMCLSVAFSPDSKHVVSGLYDGTIQIWDAETGKQVGEPFRGHTGWVRSVGFSPDGKRIVIGSDIGTIRIWDAETGKQVGAPFRGHTDTVWSVGFSHDGRRIVSGSNDETIRIWDAETGKQMGGPFRGHTGWVLSVGFSPDGERIVSGSHDKTIRIWDAETGKQVGEPFEGHTNSVCSVGFSPDGKRVVSGSNDRTIRIWDAEAGKQVGAPFRGHTGYIQSVGFLPNGKRIVSGSGKGKSPCRVCAICAASVRLCTDFARSAQTVAVLMLGVIYPARSQSGL